jgi:hypothetical protein
MSEFKFACPVCSQHITSDSSASGTQIECPTCFQKLIVPQPPAADQKLILTATLAGAKRTTQAEAVAEAASRPRSRNRALPVSSTVLFLLLVGAAAFVAYKSGYLQNGVRTSKKPGQTNLTVAVQTAAPPAEVIKSPYLVPTNIFWKLDLPNVVISEHPVAGRIEGQGFGLERASIERGSLSLRQGKGWPPDLAVTLIFFSHTPEELAGKTIEVAADRTPPLPRVIKRWKTDKGEARSKEYKQGYALKAVFEKPKEGRLAGQIYLALPDDKKSFLSGTFSAEIRKPQPKKPATPKPPPTNSPTVKTN